MLNEVQGPVKNRKCEAIHRILLNIDSRWELGDHIDGNGLNNQKNNLRIATNSQNQANRKNVTSIKKVSKYIGTTTGMHGLWRAACQKNNKLYYKSFKTEIEAALWYNEKAKELHGEFAAINIIN